MWSNDINPSPRGKVDVGQSAPAIDLNYNVYTAAGWFFSFDPGGDLIWTRFSETGEILRNSPVIGKNGVVYFAYHTIPLTALYPVDGHTLWTLDPGVNDHVFASTAVGADGTIIIATNPGVVYAVTEWGKLLWTFDAASIGYSCTMRSSPAVDADETICFGTNSDNSTPMFLALNPHGMVKWTFKPLNLPADVSFSHFDMYTSPEIGSDDVVYFGQEFGRVYALRPEGGVAWMVETETGITWSSPALSMQGTHFISDIAGLIYAIETAGRGLKIHRPSPNSGAAIRTGDFWPIENYLFFCRRGCNSSPPESLSAGTLCHRLMKQDDFP